MQELAQKLINLRKKDDKEVLSSAIFGGGSLAGLNLDASTSIRIGMWPAISAEAPEVANGLMAALAALLERWRGVTVYRIFAKLDGEPENYEWTVAKSQFEVEDWQIDGLDDNTGIWGRLEQAADGWQFTVEVESDFIEADDPKILMYQSRDINGIVNWLPTAAGEIVKFLEIEAQPTIKKLYDTQAQRDEDEVKALLSSFFEWELGLLSGLWGVPWNVQDSYERLIGEDDYSSNDFGAWLVASAIARTMLPGYSEFEAHLPGMDFVLERLNYHPLAGIVLGNELYAQNREGMAVEGLEKTVEAYPDNADAWLVLANMYRQSGDLLKAVDTFQRAIEAEALSAALLFNYAQLLPLMEGAGWVIDAYILIDPEEITEQRVAWEAIEACEEAMRHNPDNPAQILATQTQLLIDVAETDEDLERVWRVFKSLVNYDEEGEYTRIAIDSLYNLEEAEPALEILEDAVEEAPLRADLRINLATAYLVLEENEYAITELEEARKLTDDPLLQAEIERLMLVATDPEFETLTSEINDRLNAGTSINSDEIDYLEEILEQAPQYIDGYIMLARAYGLQNDTTQALEVLLDAEKVAPTDPDILEGLARLLWNSGETDAAYGYIRRGLKANPLHVPLLTLMGQFLFDDDDHDGARACLLRAEAISPRHPSLLKTRAYIARMLSSDGGDE